MIVPGMGGELDDAWKNLKSNVSEKVGGELDRMELGLTVAAYASVGALIFAAWAAWNTRRKS